MLTRARRKNLQVAGLSATNGFIESINETQYRFTPNPEFNGTVDLSYVATDNNGGTAHEFFIVNEVEDILELCVI